MLHSGHQRICSAWAGCDGGAASQKSQGAGEGVKGGGRKGKLGLPTTEFSWGLHDMNSNRNPTRKSSCIIWAWLACWDRGGLIKIKQCALEMKVLWKCKVNSHILCYILFCVCELGNKSTSVLWFTAPSRATRDNTDQSCPQCCQPRFSPTRSCTCSFKDICICGYILIILV